MQTHASMSPRISSWFFEFVYAIGDLIGLPSYQAAVGYGLFKFWSF